MTVTFKTSPNGARKFRTAVSLHSHTLHSHETLAFCYRLAGRYSSARRAVRFLEGRFRKYFGCELDLRRGWWTPPLTPYAAWRLEHDTIERGLGLAALVSLSDHDDIEAPLSLRVLAETRSIPLSVEWSVPIENSFIHLGIHNLPADRVREAITAFAAYTAEPSPARLAELLEWTSSEPQTLVVFNHPCWDECGITDEAHALMIRRFLARYGQFIHALEVNGLRPWPENKRAIELGRAFDRPVISGGDRHGFEPNAVLNLTNASDFEEFVDEIRSGVSNILVADHYRESYAMRIIRNFEEMARDLPDHPLGRVRWCDRVFYQCDDGAVRSLNQLFEGRVPRSLEAPLQALGVFRYETLQRAMRFALPPTLI